MGLYEPEFGLAKVKERHSRNMGHEGFSHLLLPLSDHEMLAIEATGKRGAAHIVPNQ